MYGGEWLINTDANELGTTVTLVGPKQENMSITQCQLSSNKISLTLSYLGGGAGGFRPPHVFLPPS